MENTLSDVISAPGGAFLPDERVLRAHLAGGEFRLGVAEKRWRLISLTRPYVMIAVSAAVRDGAPDEYVFRFEFSNYPHEALTACPWDLDAKNIPLPTKWPGGVDRVEKAFNPGWRQDALYLPCDRIARMAHDQWVTEHPEYLWSADKEITFYLEIIYDYLHSRHYTGLRRA
jgi:hypothetical protein